MAIFSVRENRPPRWQNGWISELRFEIIFTYDIRRLHEFYLNSRLFYFIYVTYENQTDLLLNMPILSAWNGIENLKKSCDAFLSVMFRCLMFSFEVLSTFWIKYKNASLCSFRFHVWEQRNDERVITKRIWFGGQDLSFLLNKICFSRNLIWILKTSCYSFTKES